MKKTETRGIHATGFWACTNDNKVIYHKEPIKSSEFMDKPIWKDTSKRKLDLLLGHCRWTSTGSGVEKINKNNHPHVSKDVRVALVHNGKIPEYHHLKKQYPVLTDCDSEILLRIFESGEFFHEQKDFLNSQLQKANAGMADLYRVYGLKKIFSEITCGHMAVAIGEHLDNDQRALWLFHNEFRPLCLIDLRETLGQFFFCSTPEIFRASVEEAKIPSKIIPMSQGVIKLPPNWIYHFRMTAEGVVNWEKIKINKTRKYGQWETDIEEAPKGDKLTRTSVEVISQLNEKEDVIVPENFFCEKIPINRKAISYSGHDTSVIYEEDENASESAEKAEFLCEKGIRIFQEIYTNVHNSVMENNLKESDLENIVIVLETIISNLENTKLIIR